MEEREPVSPLDFVQQFAEEDGRINLLYCSKFFPIRKSESMSCVKSSCMWKMKKIEVI